MVEGICVAYHLQETREKETTGKVKRGKKVNIQPGKSVQVKDFVLITKEAAETREANSSQRKCGSDSGVEKVADTNHSFHSVGH
jgi:hypothetical protein